MGGTSGLRVETFRGSTLGFCLPRPAEANRARHSGCDYHLERKWSSAATAGMGASTGPRCRRSWSARRTVNASALPSFCRFDQRALAVAKFGRKSNCQPDDRDGLPLWRGFDSLGRTFPLKVCSSSPRRGCCGSVHPAKPGGTSAGLQPGRLFQNPLNRLF